MWEITVSKVDDLNTYGIKIGNTIIEDISPDREKIEKFVECLNQNGASEIHAYELVEDFFGMP